MNGALRLLSERIAAALRGAAGMLVAGWRIYIGLLRRVAEIVLALVILFEEWGWRPLAEVLARLARWQPVARIEAVIAALPPYLALVAFVLPTTLFFPLKLLAVYLIAKGQALLATGVFLAAKVFGTALLARIFQLTQPALMRIPWFAAAYSRFVPWKEETFAAIRQTWVWRRARLIKASVAKSMRPFFASARLRIGSLIGQVRRQVRVWLSHRSP